MPTRLEIDPGGVLLTPGDPTRRLTVSVFDQLGRPLDTPVTWTSSAPAAISVTADGLVEAHDPVASALVTATASGAHASVLVVAAEPVDGAVVIADDDVIGEPSPVDPAAEYGVGFQYRITITGIAAPPIGVILLTNGVKPVFGKVVAVDTNVITLEMVPIDEIFAHLDIDAIIDLADAPFTTPQGLDAAFDSERLPDGSVRLQQRPGVILSSAGPIAPQAEFGAGPFRCETELGAVQITLARSTMTFQPDMTFHIVWNDTQHKIVVSGSPRVTLDVNPVLAAAIEGKVTCTFTFREIHIPLPGPIGGLIGGVVPIGAGFEIEGKLPIAQVGFEFKSDVGADLEFGFDCAPACTPVETLTPVLAGNATPVLPASLSGLTVEASAYAFLFANFEGGARFSSTARVEAIESAAGIKFEAKLASEETQAFDDAYASQYDLLFEASIGAGTGFERFLSLIRVTVAKLELKLVESIAKSPRGSATADLASFSAGDTVNFTVTLDPATIDFPVIGPNVAAVRIYRKTSDSLVLANQLTPGPSQTTLHIPWVATIDGTVEGTFIAFVETNLLAFPRLELGAVSASAPGTATLTYAEEEVRHEEASSEGFFEQRHMDRSATATLQLLVVSSTPSEVIFEVASGTVSHTFTESLIRDEQGLTSVDHPECLYDLHAEFHATYTGSGQGSEPVSLFVNVGSGTYTILSDQEYTFAHDWVSTGEVTHHGTDTSCAESHSDSGVDEGEDALRILVNADIDPSAPSVFTGTDLLELPGTTRTTTWRLEIH